ncbi:PAS domain S-box protein [Halorhodospira abdelmalekii]|uniref:PAS domain S-box protein n=1 Tax=Halorhodospira abdelmalekii TaxID=421629 RepID=UPI001907DED1|nr:PAS domain S-box protein [Halorhodospira abdelmalekii]
MDGSNIGQRQLDFFQNLLDSSPGALCALDPAGRFTYLNAAACQLLGYPDEAALLGVEFASVLDADRTPLETAAVTTRLLAVATTGEPLCGDTMVWLQPRVGNAFPVAMEAAALRSGETAAGGVVLTLRDCTAQQARERFQQRLIAILDSTPDLVSLHDTDGNLIYFNEAGRTRFDLPQLPRLGDTGGAHADDSLPPCPSVEEAIRRCHPPWAAERLLNEGLPTAWREGLWQGETAFLDVEGQEIPASQVIIGHRDASGNVVQLSAIIRDISELKRAQQEVAESERRFRLIAEHVRDAFWLRTPERTLYVNPAYERIWGEPIAHFYADPHSFLNSVHPEDREEIESALKRAIETHETLDMRYRIVRPDGAVRWIESQSQPITVSGTAEVLRAGIARDVTDEVVAAERIRQLAAILDNTPDIVALHKGSGGQLLYLNAAGRALVGAEAEDVEGGWCDPDSPSLSPHPVEEAARRFHPPWAAERLLNEGLPTARREGLWQGETALIGRDGEEIPTSQVLIAHRNATGEITHLSTILRDLSRRKAIETRLRQREAELVQQETLYRELVESHPHLIGRYAPDTTTLFANQAMVNFFGLQSEQLIGKQWLAQLPEQEREAARRYLAQFTPEAPVHSVELPQRRADGQVRWIHWTNTAHFDEQQNLTHFQAVGVDTTERRRAEEALRESEQRFREMAESIDEVFWVRTADEMLYLNPAYARQTGLPLESTYAHPNNFIDHIHPEDREQIATKIYESAAGGADFDEVFRYIRPDNGELRWFHSRCSPIYGCNGEILRSVGVARDITDRQEALIQLEAANRAKTDFLNAVSHDLRTPLNAIIGFTDLLAESSLDAAQRRQVELCQAAGCTLLGLIDTLLDLSRLEGGRFVLQNEPFALRAFLSEQMAIVAGQAEEKGLQLEWSVDADVPEPLFGDTIRFSQVLFNLVVNAIKFTERGHVVVRITRYCDRLLQVEVEDSGPGIPIELQQKIFEPFERGTADARRLQGSGLGLAISRELVQMMGGTLRLSSIPGKGSTFRFTAQLIPDSGEAVAHRGSNDDCNCTAMSEESVSIDGVRVLVAEDDPTNTLLIQALLERCGAQPTIVEHGQAALEAWQEAEDEFDLILLDVKMPVLDGAQTAQAIRAAEAEQGRPHTPIAMLSAHATAEVRKQCLQSGADTYLTKPIRLDALVELLCWARCRS